MNVQELIEALQTCDKDLNVCCGYYSENFDNYLLVTNVSQHTNYNDEEITNTDTAVYIEGQ